MGRVELYRTRIPKISCGRYVESHVSVVFFSRSYVEGIGPVWCEASTYLGVVVDKCLGTDRG